MAAVFANGLVVASARMDAEAPAPYTALQQNEGD